MTSKTVRVPVNNHYYDTTVFDNDFCNESSEQKTLKAIYNTGCFNTLTEADLLNDDAFSNVRLMSFRQPIQKDNDGLVYRVCFDNNNYYLKTGNYIGYISIDGKKIEINSGYPDVFLQRMLNVALNIFVNTNSTDAKKDDENTILKTLVEYLFIMSIKKAIKIGMPQSYTRIEESGLNIKGNLNIHNYIKHGIFNPSKIDYSFLLRVVDKEVASVIYAALHYASIEKDPEIKRFESDLKQSSISGPITFQTIKKAKNSKVLTNPMYSIFRQILTYAEILLLKNGLVINEGNKTNNVSGFFLDITELWEIYLSKLIENRFSDFRVEQQKDISIYSEPRLFFARNYYIDILVVTPSNRTLVLDAKFKHMNFDNGDVDRNDLHQIHSYAGYFNQIGNVALASLIYPTRTDPEKLLTGKIYGISKSKTIFSVNYIKVGDTFDEMCNNEQAFLDRIYECL